jgi:hypothetical protein
MKNQIDNMKKSNLIIAPRRFEKPTVSWASASDEQLLAEVDRALGHDFDADAEVKKAAEFLYLSSLTRPNEGELARILKLETDLAEKWAGNLRYAEIWSDGTVKTHEWFAEPNLSAFAADVLVAVGKIGKTYDDMLRCYSIFPSELDAFLQLMTKLNMHQQVPIH